eukprot:1184617-Prorocentrum_minimum.AAC.1
MSVDYTPPMVERSGCIHKVDGLQHCLRKTNNIPGTGTSTGAGIAEPATLMPEGGGSDKDNEKVKKHMVVVDEP